MNIDIGLEDKYKLSYKFIFHSIDLLIFIHIYIIFIYNLYHHFIDITIIFTLIYYRFAQHS